MRDEISRESVGIDGDVKVGNLGSSVVGKPGVLKKKR